MTVVNLRGTNGSGKTTIVRNLLAMSKSREIFGACGPRRPEAYEMKLPKVHAPTYLIGPYNMPTGGCDAVKFPKLIQELVTKYRELGNVIFEGLIISDYYGSLMQSLEPLGKQVIVAYLTTPFEVCRERTAARSGTKLKATPKALFPWVEKLVGEHADGSVVAYHYAGIARTKINMITGPIYGGIFRIEDVSSDTGHLDILEWLK